MKNIIILFAIIAISTSYGKAQNQKVDVLIEKLSFIHNDNEKIDLYEKILLLDPNRGYYYGELVELYEKKGDIASVIKTCERAMKHYKTNGYVSSQSARFYSKMKDAISDWKENLFNEEDIIVKGGTNKYGRKSFQFTNNTHVTFYKVSGTLNGSFFMTTPEKYIIKEFKPGDVIEIEWDDIYNFDGVKFGYKYATFKSFTLMAEIRDGNFKIKEVIASRGY